MHRDAAGRAARRIGDAGDLLRAAGLRSTPQRRRLLEVLADADRPASPEEIWERSGKESGDRATVYRVVHDLTGVGIVHHAYTIGRTSYYELSDHCGSVSCHPHFMCSRCGAVSCLYDVEPAALPDIGGGYVVERSKITLIGICPECNRKSRLGKNE